MRDFLLGAAFRALAGPEDGPEAGAGAGGANPARRVETRVFEFYRGRVGLSAEV